MKNFKYLLLILFTIFLSACGDNPVRVQGRLSFFDGTGCTSPVANAQTVSFTRCREFKGFFDRATGLPSTDSSIRSETLRPLPATIQLEFFRGPRAEREPLFTKCGGGRFVTNRNGIYNVKLFFNDKDPYCAPGTSGLIAIGEVRLEYKMFSNDFTKKGTIRAFWQQSQALPLLEDETVSAEFDVGETAYTTTSPEGVETRFAVPSLIFLARDISIPTTTAGSAEPVINLGTKIFLNRAGEDRYGYLRQLLTGYTNVVMMHEELKTVLGSTNEFFDKMYVNPPDGTSGWGKSYGIYFDNTWAFGGHGWMAVLRPNVEIFREDGNGDGNPDGSWSASWLLSDTSVLSHELGHSLQGAYAVKGVPFDYDFAGKMMKRDGTEYDWGHGGWQHADMGAAMQEGIANTYGQYLLNRCNGSVATRRPGTGLDAAAISFNANGGIWAQSTSCDSVDACNFHHTRWHLRSRGLTEGSTDFSARSSRINALNSDHRNNNGGLIMSNNEFRAGEFGCDFLDTESSVAHAAAVSSSYSYIPDFTYWVAQYLDGSTASRPAPRFYSSSATNEDVVLPFETFVKAYGEYCSDCDTLPGSRAWGATYNQKRLSIDGSIAPQSLGKFLERSGAVSRAQLNNILRSNFMEEVR